MIKVTGVDCLFDIDGRVHVRRIKFHEEWLPVEQGRQWLDEQGHHVLIMTSGSAVQELLLSRETLQWQMPAPRAGSPII